jgi:nucleoside-diphosphate-sugar epimerase
MKKISILGCGWLGLPLAKSLIEKGFSIKGSTTSEEKLEVLQKAGIEPFLIAIKSNKVTGNIVKFLDNSEILIIDIPPDLRYGNTESFIEKMKQSIPFLEQSTIKKLIFVSSTSVYSGISLDCAREDNIARDEKFKVTEETIAVPENESGIQLLASEKILMSNKHFATTIVRFGGLIGEDRNPTKFLAGRKNIENPNAPINFIHQKDCIGIIEKIIETNSWNQIYNGVAPFHPTRKDYYTQKAKEMGLEIPEFDETKPSFGKIVSSEKAVQVLGYNFLVLL